MSIITVQAFDKRIMEIFPNTEILTLDEFKTYPKFCPLDANGDMYHDPEHDFTKLARIYKINDFERDEFEDYDFSFILIFSESDSIISSRCVGYGTDSYREKMETLF